MKLQVVESKIRNFSSIGRITSALKTISFIKIKKIKKEFDNIRESCKELNKMVEKRFYSNCSKSEHNYTENEKIKSIRVLFSIDKKFCKDFLFIASSYFKTIEPNQSDFFITFGKYAIEFSKFKNLKRNSVISNLNDSYEVVKEILKKMKTGKYRLFFDFYKNSESKFISQEILKPIKEKKLSCSDENLLYLNLTYQIYLASIENGLMESSSRAMAMSQASDTCDDMKHKLELELNRIRQEKITLEMTEIIGGMNA
ncbi:F0F1 ATP synthase subunit gamma [Candidatus Nesciobacter abundans]|uniref:F0F1 ATP synthase subunit gamma n=1 Tax=Candidatus Nesciobacter abundans TaxID=2601668 RepID=A0A5C0UGX2_9PROT|nr:F0F1 ATP synthase subunit gamma [Candidatus Nesciobacter abundans]QEK38947.1 hypothetical protein FZC36_00650 [Candidatus Nesciobacter abundans]